MKIAIAGLGYVGLANAILLSRKNEVVALDISTTRVEMLNNQVSPIADSDIERFLKGEEINFRATTDCEDAFVGASLYYYSDSYGF